MKTRFVSRGVLRTVVTETGRVWVRRNRGPLIVAAVATVLAIAGLAGGRFETSETVLGLVAGVVPVVIGLLSMSGLVSEERDSGLIVMWFQKPGSMVRFYGMRYAILQGFIGGSGLFLGLLVGLIGGLAGFLPVSTAQRLPLVTLFAAIVPASIVFALSAWGVRRDAVVAILVMIVTTTIAASFAFDEGTLARIGKTIAFPVDALQAIGGQGPSAHNLVGAVGLTLAHAIVWTILGLAGLVYSVRSLQSR